jgi:hypothetical protein
MSGLTSAVTIILDGNSQTRSYKPMPAAPEIANRSAAETGAKVQTNNCCVFSK